jgi:hypothetical protein
LLGAGNFIAEMDVVEAGAADWGGVFYTLAAEYDRSLFELLRVDAAAGTRLVGRLRTIEDPWRVSARATNVKVRDVRRLLVSDEEVDRMQGEFPGGWRDFEARELSIRRGCQHGDMHGLNVLTAPGDRGVLIDYGEVTDQAPACLDTAVLELSLVFHPAASGIRGAWRTAENARAWDQLDDYLVGCPAPEFVRACRSWAFAVSAGDREVYATVYSSAVRQLKYGDTDHEIARAIATSAMTAFGRQ